MATSPRGISRAKPDDVRGQHGFRHFLRQPDLGRQRNRALRPAAGLQARQRIELPQPGGWKYIPITAPVNMRAGISRTSRYRPRNQTFEGGETAGPFATIFSGRSVSCSTVILSSIPGAR